MNQPSWFGKGSYRGDRGPVSITIESVSEDSQWVVESETIGYDRNGSPISITTSARLVRVPTQEA